MKFLVDAQLPPTLARLLARLLARHGHDAVHTDDLAAGSLTDDDTISRLSVDEGRVVVSKDAGFVFSLLLHGRPWKLVAVRTGNISTRDLTALIERHLPAVVAALQSHALVEVDRVAVTPVR